MKRRENMKASSHPMDSITTWEEIRKSQFVGQCPIEAKNIQ